MSLFELMFKRKAKTYAKGLCRTMTISISALKEEYADKSGSEIFGMALLTRPGWETTKVNAYQYKNQHEIIIDEDGSLRSTLKDIANCELQEHLKHLTVAERQRLIFEAYFEIDKY